MVAREICGMILMVVAGIGVSSMLIVSTVAERLGFPFYILMGSALLSNAFLCTLVTCLRAELRKVESHQWKWVFMRGFFGCATYVQMLIAVSKGAPLGDVSALTSVNIVVAALLGRAFLREDLRFLHIVALFVSIVGAVLVSQPETLFGQGNNKSSQSWMGYLLALGSGITSGWLFIASRKSQGIAPLILTLSVSAQEGTILCLLSLFNLVSESPMQMITDFSLELVYVFLALLALVFIASATLSLGAQMCPAAMSSTVFTSTSMLLGYITQVYLHGDTPNILTMSGAALMLTAVALMAFARQANAKILPESLSIDKMAPHKNLQKYADVGSGASEQLADDNDSDSLVSFVAAEFSGIALKDQTLRKRAAAAFAAVIPVQTIGSALA